MSQFIYIINLVFQIISLAIIARALISWFPISPYHPVVTLLNQITEPFLAPLRRLLPSAGGMDLSPLVAIILLQVIERILISVLIGGPAF
ncbi:MAG: YggT family protein [Anaerolineae bacterium]|nr:YggT family protein [Anaerolineae bacterium]